MGVSRRRARAAVRRDRTEVRAAPAMVAQVTIPDSPAFYGRSKYGDGSKYQTGSARYGHSRYGCGATYGTAPDPGPPTARYGRAFYGRGYVYGE